MNPEEYQARLLELLELGLEERCSWVSALSDAQRDETGSFERWSAKDFITHIAFWHAAWAGVLAAVRTDASDAGYNGYDDLNEQVYAERRDWDWSRVLANADSSQRTLADEVRRWRAADLSAPRSGAPLFAAAAGRRAEITGYWHVLDHEIQFYVERGDIARADRLQERSFTERTRHDPTPQGRGVALYNLACHYAVTGRPAQALPPLRDALRLRPDLVEWSQQDHDLDSLHGDPTFQALVGGGLGGMP